MLLGRRRGGGGKEGGDVYRGRRGKEESPCPSEMQLVQTHPTSQGQGLLLVSTG